MSCSGGSFKELCVCSDIVICVLIISVVSLKLVSVVTSVLKMVWEVLVSSGEVSETEVCELCTEVDSKGFEVCESCTDELDKRTVEVITELSVTFDVFKTELDTW